MRGLVIYIVLFFTLHTLRAQNPAGLTTYRLQKATDLIELDGNLNEESWKNAEIATNFHMVIPYDDRPASYESEVRMTYDDDFFYFGIICYDNTDDYVVQSLRRDWDWPLNENFSIYLDPYDDFTNGFTFGVSPYGAQREGTIEDGTLVNADWDNKWYSEVKRFEDKWVAELKIPFKSIRYNENNMVWNMQFFRNHLKINERSTWVAVEQQYTPSALTFSGKVIWPEPPPKTGRNVSFIPYALGSFSEDRTEGISPGVTGNIGFDAKVSVSPSLNLDLTVNPDFSQVEVDQQVINLSRFEFQFPERRQFFLENADLFGKFGFPNSRAFFSRRIGIATDTLGRSDQLPILFGARLSGKLNENWRLGFLNMTTDQSASLNQPYQNYSVLAMQRRVLKRSNVGLVVVNRHAFGVDESQPSLYSRDLVRREFEEGDSIDVFRLSNTVVGLEYNLFSEDTRWEGDFYLQQSYDRWNQQSTFNNYNAGTFLRYRRRHYSLFMSHTSIGEDFRADVGFVPRVGYHSVNFAPTWITYPKTPKIIFMETSLRGGLTTNTAFDITDWDLSFSHEINFSNTAYLSAALVRNYELMFFDFNPIRPLGDSTLVTGTDYIWDRLDFSFNSDRRSLFNYDLGASYGGFYNGNRFNLNGSLNYRYQPFGSIAMTFDYNDLRMPEWLGDAQFFLVGPRLDLTLTDKLFITTFVQYNNRIDNVNINARLQWRFAPASDIFLVYTENYLPPSFDSKNRALVLKFNYWLNL